MSNLPEITISQPELLEPSLGALDTQHLVELFFARSVFENASDLHIEPNRNELCLRIRVDGVLENFFKLPLGRHKEVIEHIKNLAKLDLNNSDIPQDGAYSFRFGENEIDLRMASFPTIFGEAIAIRISLRRQILTLEELGLSDLDRKNFELLINRPNGIILVTGPTGSGKTTSLYVALQMIDRTKKHVLTVEDPAEREIEGVAQTQINTARGLNFPTVLRAMLREDPDVIMVGEIRDRETAEMSLRAAMTGNLVLSTLHTSSAVGAVARLSDLGLENYLIAATLVGLMGQRLLRRICQSCKVMAAISESEYRALGPRARGLEAFVGKGCKDCKQKGYRGRIGIFELIPIDDELRVLIANRAPEVRLLEKASSLGCRTMLEDGLDKIHRGLVSVKDVVTVCGK
jgi:type II secretory ATPase GspE/PulE/Tfp pilus assembly ATPase PilB-like protein